MKRSAQRRVLNVLAAVDAVRERHPELMAPANPRVVWRVLEREGIDVRRGRRIHRKARSSKFDGDAVITLRQDLPTREAWKWALHEYGHIVMHFPLHGEHERQLSPCRAGDPREDEATLFAALLVLGSAATVEHPIPAAIAAKITAGEYSKRPVRQAEQLQLGVQRGAPKFQPRRVSMYEYPIGPMPEGGSQTFERQEEELRRMRRRRPRIRVGESHESLLFDWSKDGKPLRFFHGDLGWVEIWDAMAIEEDGRRRIVTLKVGDQRAQRRVFVVNAGDRRRYAFEEGETRGRSVQQLIDQMRYAERIQPDEGRPSIVRFKIRDAEA